MKKFLARIMVLATVFLVGLLGTIFFMNKEITDNRGNYNSSTMPEVMFKIDGELVNRMYGYKQKMQVDFARDSLTPLDTGRTLNFVINSYGNEVSSIAYEIRTSDGSKVMENKKLKNLTQSEEYLTVTTTIESSLLMNQEYSLQLAVDVAGDTYYYYSRLIQRSNINASAYIRFVTDFSDRTRNKASAEKLTDYLETDYRDNTINYAKIDIHSPWEAISWGNLNPSVTQKGVPVIKDINETTGSISLEYQVEVYNKQGARELYNVEEFYRMRYTEEAMILLDFERNLTQVFDGTLPVITEEGLVLGVRDRSVHYMTNDALSFIASVQEGDLWTFEPASGKLTQIFTFREKENSDFRDNRNEHDIKIIRVEDDGSVDFVLYGYMNRGKHEGYSGVSICHYSSDQNVVTEKIFIPSTESYEFLKMELGTLSYVNAQGNLYLMFSDKLYEVDIENRSYKILEPDIDQDSFKVSETNAHAAWSSLDKNGKKCLKEIDFDTGKTKTVSAGDNQRIIILGFFNEDVVYGLAFEENVLYDIRGNEIAGMSTIKIEDFQGNIKKAYESEDLVTEVSMEPSIMEMQICKKEGGSFIPYKKDSIMNSVKVVTSMVNMELYTDERLGIVVRMSLGENLDVKNGLVIYSKYDLTESAEVTLDGAVLDEDSYYVYAKGHLYDIYSSPAEAIVNADANMGVVLNRRQQYIWERGNRRSSIMLTLDNIPEAFLQGTTDINILQAALEDTGTVMDLTGCTLDMVLYSVNAQKPVIVKTGSDEIKVIVGYDEVDVWLYSPKTEVSDAFTKDEMEEIVEQNGKLFITYMDNLE